MKPLIVLLALALLSHEQNTSWAATKFVCYFPNWAFYRQGSGKFTVQNINADLCTHVIYAFAVLDPVTYSIRIHDPFVDIENQSYIRFNGLKLKRPDLKTMIAIGGWNDSQGPKYSQLVSDPAKIEAFVRSALSFLKKHKFDGLDLDWEFPLSVSDKLGLTKLLRVLRSSFKKDGYLLSIAVSISQAIIDEGYDVPSINQNVDWINLLSYDFHGSWEKDADHHSPLRRRPWETTNNNVDAAVNYWINKRADPSKLVLGIPLYGRSWKLVSTSVIPPAPAAGPGTPGPFTKEAGFLAYYEICSKRWKVTTDPSNRMGPFAHSSAEWVGYDDPQMAAVKTEYAVSRGLGGVMVWELSMDDFGNVCGKGANPILTAISKALRDSNSTLASEVSTRATSETAIGSTTTKRPVTGATCPGRDGYYADPVDPSKFFICIFGKFAALQCPSGLFFNRRNNVCDWPSNVSQGGANDRDSSELKNVIP